MFVVLRVLGWLEALSQVALCAGLARISAMLLAPYLA
jgi:hypothetical protein